MRRSRLVLAMLFSLWPLVLVAVVAASSGKSESGTENVVVPTPPAETPRTQTKPFGTPTTKAPESQTVKIKVGGKTYWCPIGTEDKLKPYRETLGELELKLRSLRASLKRKEARLRVLDKRYPGGTAPASVADEYNAMAHSARAEAARDDRLVHAYNREVEEYNHILDANCSS